MKMNKNELKDFRYRIPMMKIQDILLGLDFHPKVIEMKMWCENNCKKPWKIGYSLERRWYTEFYFESRWDIADFMREFSKYM